MRCIFKLSGLVMLISIGLLARSSSVWADELNRLINGGLDGSYHPQCTRIGGNSWDVVLCDPAHIDSSTTILWGNVQVPGGWSAWWRSPNADQTDPNYFNSYPAYCPDKSTTPPNCVPWHAPDFRDTATDPQGRGPDRRVGGDNSQKLSSFSAVYAAGLFQTVSGLTPGTVLRFSVNLEAWSSSDNDPSISSGQASMNLRVGIDPTGGTNPNSADIVWSAEQDSFDRFSVFSIESTALADHVTVFTYARPVLAVQHNDVYIDAASLIELNAALTPTVSSTDTGPTATPTETATAGPTRTPIPTATPRSTITPTPTVSPTATITHVPTAIPSPTATRIPVLVVGSRGINQFWVAIGILISALVVAYIVMRLISSGSSGADRPN